MPAPERPAEIRAWLEGHPSLAEMRERFPDEWETVQRELATVTGQGDPEAVKRYAASLARAPRVTPGGRAGRSPQDALMRAQVRQHLAAAALRQLGVSAVTGVQDGRLRFNLVNGWLAQRLLFSHDLVRKPVGLRRFRVLWPLVWQKRFLMPLVEPKGIYCFYSGALVARLAELIGDRPTLEIAAGDGTLSRFLREAGVAITATDDGSWTQITLPEDVQRKEARQALRAHAPRAVVCSWPPAGNPFERFVFETPGVELYVVIGSRHEFAAGNWDAYRRQAAFTFAEDPELSRLVLPPEIDPAVYVFRPQRDRAAA